MNLSQDIAIHFPSEKELSSKELTEIVALINTVYLTSEGDFWPQDGSYQRTTMQEITNFISRKELLLVQLESSIVGVAHIYPIKDSLCGFGMLVTAPPHRKKGLGTTMITTIENWALKYKYQSIQLELLRPIDYLHPEKEFLKQWYTSLGYQMVSSTAYADLYPDQAHLLKVPCTFDIYQKNLKK